MLFLDCWREFLFGFGQAIAADGDEEKDCEEAQDDG